MKRNSILLFILLIVFIACEQSDSPNGTENNDDSVNLQKLFPYFQNDIFKFNIDTLNTADNKYYQTGTRVSEISAEERINEKEYYVCNQRHKFENIEFEYQTKFRITESSVYLRSDTSRVSEVLPDSLSDVKISVEEEILLLQLPLKTGERWPVVKAYVDFHTFKFNTVDVEAEYIGKETLVLDDFSDPVETFKVKYKLDINSPNLENPFLSETVTYFAEDMGIIKMEGCSFMLNTVVGFPMNFEDIELNSRQILTSIY